MILVSFNVNSIRTRLHQLQAVIDTYQPDVIGLQETKVTDDQFPVDDIRAMGYEPHCHGQKTHYGVALLSKIPADGVQKGYPWDDEEAQRRLITARYPVGGQTVTVINGYFPQGESRDHPTKFPAKETFYKDLMTFLERETNPDDPVIVMGDMNISPQDIDIGIGEQNRKRWLRDGKCSFLPEEREWLTWVEQWGLTDVFRNLYPDEDNTFSWFDYRSRGFERDPRRGLRIDLIMASRGLLPRAKAAGVSYDIRAMERPSDHCPIWAEFDL
ncbi:exodeoxyribonuclease III [Tamilnaduibacter salinus]|uniref:Exodeoxyribonuclease III n=1 Tax=Tamilnaduibacter salinus TaxID=1484056 RepID=A0A2A2I091_9GAMM|nr:exodeoxyribonuclease III [Tamilnaduibacter salinus]PAV24565.1 exodeoxyribonuclease III [Tamilnaduibacter salinus]PVY78062.1 exodeoxyribonuclease III [Tamilnaduibacter salinus]